MASKSAAAAIPAPSECEFFIVQHGQGSNNGKRSGYEAWLKSKQANSGAGAPSDDLNEFPYVPDNCDINRMAFPLYVFMSTDEVNNVFREFIKDPGKEYTYNGSFYQVMKLFLNRAQYARHCISNIPTQTDSHAEAKGDEPENNMKFLLKQTLQRFTTGDTYFDELLEGDLTKQNDNDFGVWMRCKFGDNWRRWVQIFGQNGRWESRVDIPGYGEYNVDSGPSFNSWRFPGMFSSYNYVDKEFMRITSGVCTEYRISSLISFLKRIFSPDCKANFIFANCSAMGQHKLLGDTRLFSTGTGNSRRPSSAHMGSCLSSRVSRVSQWVKSHPYDIESQLANSNVDNNDIYKYWANILKTLYRRISIAKEGNNKFNEYIDEVYIHKKKIVSIKIPELGRCLTIMDVAERHDWYQVIGSLLHMLEYYKPPPPQPYNSFEKMKSDLHYIIDQGSRSIYNNGISPVIADRPEWTLSSTFMDRRPASRGRDRHQSRYRNRPPSQPPSRSRSRSRDKSGRGKTKKKKKKKRKKNNQTRKPKRKKGGRRKKTRRRKNNKK